jgi:hypothetical protein
MVLAVGGKAKANGNELAPAVITRVWSEREDGSWLVNATLLPDASAPAVITSVYLFEDEQAARDSLQHETSTALFWPPRV